MALDEPGIGYRPPKRKPALPRFPLPGAGSVPLLPGAPTSLPAPVPVPDWASLIASDPGYLQDLADIGADSVGDRQRTLAALRAALIQFGGGGLADVVGKLGAGWGDILDSATLGAAGAADTGGTSLSAQLEKAHRDKLLAEEDIRAARGILSSGQTGYEIGEENLRHTNSVSDAVNALTAFLSGHTGGFAGRESQRNRDRSGALDRARDRVMNSGLEPPMPPPVINIIEKILRQPPSLNPRRPAGRPTGWAE